MDDPDYPFEPDDGTPDLEDRRMAQEFFDVLAIVVVAPANLALRYFMAVRHMSIVQVYKSFLLDLLIPGKLQSDVILFWRYAFG